MGRWQRPKSADKHDIGQAEAESVFFNDPLIVLKMQGIVKRRGVSMLWENGSGALLHITFHPATDPGTKVRVISARDMHRKERKAYEPALKVGPDLQDPSEERKFWETHDSTDYVDWSKAERVRLPT